MCYADVYIKIFRSTIASYDWVEWNTFNDPRLNLWISHTVVSLDLYHFNFKTSF